MRTFTTVRDVMCAGDDTEDLGDGVRCEMCDVCR